jgi:hypothetical protein
MKKFLLTLLAIVLILGVLAGAGFVGYRFGYRQGALAASPSNSNINTQPFARDNDFDWKRMPMPNFRNGPDRGFHPGFGPGGFGMMHHGRGFGFFSPIRFVLQLAVLGLIIWLVYKLLTGWRFTFTRATPESRKVEPAPEPAESETQNTEEQSN